MGRIRLDYVLADPDPAVLDDLETAVSLTDVVNNISKVRFRLVLSNDYKVEVTSDQQTDNAIFEPRPVFRTMVRAPGNVQDHSNLGAVVFDYGLPTATQVLGFTVEADDLAGFRLYGEFNVNHQYRKYPDVSRTTHTTSSGIRGNPAAEAWMINVAKDFHPYYLFGEAFGMDAEYSTTMRFLDSAGRVNYADTPSANSRYLYDFVDDNDDNDRKNDQNAPIRRRPDTRGTEQHSRVRGVRGRGGFFPALDENHDFISDFNQNNTRVRPNSVPDYAEPFLRYSVDRPEYLFGIDMNNNGWGGPFRKRQRTRLPIQARPPRIQRVRRCVDRARCQAHRGPPARAPSLNRRDQCEQLCPSRVRAQLSRRGRADSLQHVEAGRGRHRRRPLPMAAWKVPGRRHDPDPGSAGPAQYLGQQNCRLAFERRGNVWRQLRE